MDERQVDVKVTHLRPVRTAEDIRLDPRRLIQSVLDDHGDQIETFVVIAEMKDGMNLVEGNCNAAVRVFLMERAKQMLLFPEDDE
jgi:hypothetical protein